MLRCLVILILASSAQHLFAGAFLAQATDRTSRDARSHIHYGDSIEHHGVVTYLIVRGKRVQFTRDNIRGFAQGFDPSKDITSTFQISALRQNRKQLETFAQRFPRAKSKCLEEIKLVDEALLRLSKGHYYLKGTWIDPSKGETVAGNTASNTPPKTTPAPLNPTSFQVTIDGKVFNATSLKIADPVEGLVSVVHSGGVTKIPARQLADPALERIPVENLEDALFLETARRQRGMSSAQLFEDQKKIRDKFVKVREELEEEKRRLLEKKLSKFQSILADPDNRTDSKFISAVNSYYKTKYGGTQRNPADSRYLLPEDVVFLFGEPTYKRREKWVRTPWLYRNTKGVDREFWMIMYEYEDFWLDPAIGKKTDLKIAIEDTGYVAHPLQWSGIYFDVYGEKKSTYLYMGR